MRPYSTERVVTWLSGSPVSVSAAWWAAWYASKHRVPLNVVDLTGASASVADSSDPGRVPAADALDAIGARYPELSVTSQQAGDGSDRPATFLTSGDVLVLGATDLAAYPRLREQVRVPMVVIPAGAVPGRPSEPRVLYLADPRMAPAAALFAFAAAEALGAPVDVVCVQTQDQVQSAGPDWNGNSADSSMSADSGLRAEHAVLARVQDRFPDVRVVRLTLRRGIRATLGTLAHSTTLTVVGQPATSDELRTVMDAGVSPVVVVPERGGGSEEDGPPGSGGRHSPSGYRD